MQYLCKAGQQVRAKAQDSAPDKDRMPLLGAPSLAGQASTGSANAAGWLSTESGQLTLLCLLYQQGLGRSDYWTSTTFQEPSTDIGYKKKKRLAKSGKDTVLWYIKWFFYLVQPHAIVCTVRFPHFTLSLYFTKVIKHIFVASCFGYLKDVRKRKYENYFSNNIYR